MDDRELTQLQETGAVILADGYPLESILDGLQALGIGVPRVSIWKVRGGIKVVVDAS